MVSRIIAYFAHLWLLAYLLDYLEVKEETGILIMTIDAVVMFILLLVSVAIFGG